MTTRSLVALMALIVIPVGPAFAGVTRCNVQDPSDADPSWVMLDVDSGKAALGWLGRTVEGRITRTSEFSTYGKKYNLVLDDPFPAKGVSSRLELLVLPTPDGEHRLLGVITVLEDGERYINAGVNNVRMKCAHKEP